MADRAPKPAYEDRVVHAYDGIEEYDNHLPNWWLFTLYGAVVFALGYWFHYEVLRTGPSIAESYEQSMAADRRAAADRARRAGAMTDDALVALSRDPATVQAGRGVFAQSCVACHAANGGGGIGPNLTDSSWLHGRSPTAILRTINEGVLARGMPAWGPQLGLDRVQSVAAYVVTLRDTNVPGGKAPQGATTLAQE
ncbi:MAG: Cytochrome c oxidase subunit CcoP [Myxococcaceae bacterium]|nr:Cytochrome c oxidase subunit CcoP [Myxococcaceae bacterium]